MAESRAKDVTELVVWRDLQGIIRKICGHFDLREPILEPLVNDDHAKILGDCDVGTRARPVIRLRVTRRESRTPAGNIRRTRTSLSLRTLLGTIVHEASHLRHADHGPEHAAFMKEIREYLGEIGVCARSASMKMMLKYAERKRRGVCPSCGKGPPLTGRAWCGKCLRRSRRGTTRKARRQLHHRLLRQYGLSLDAYESMVRAQEGRCAICRQDEPDRRRGRLAVDHDHRTGVVRGLLCTRCNTGLGAFGDDPEMVRTAERYLRGAKS